MCLSVCVLLLCSFAVGLFRVFIVSVCACVGLCVCMCVCVCLFVFHLCR